MNISADRFARFAALVVAGGLVVLSGFQLFWALGGDWGLDAASGGEISDPSAGVRLMSALFALVLLGACLLVLGRAGFWGSSLSPRIFAWGTWGITAVLFLGALQNLAAQTDWERFGNGPIALVLAILALAVARSGPKPVRPRARHHIPGAA